MSDPQLTGMLARCRMRMTELRNACEVSLEVHRADQKKHQPESADWRRLQHAIEINEAAIDMSLEEPQ